MLTLACVLLTRVGIRAIVAELVRTEAGLVWAPPESRGRHARAGRVRPVGQGQRAVYLLLLSAAAYLNFYLVEYVSTRRLTVHTIHVSCDGTLQERPERLGRIVVKVMLDGALTEKERHRMLGACERA